MTPDLVTADLVTAEALAAMASWPVAIDYNTRVVVLGATLLGVVAGLVGSFTLLRKRALVGDALSHATLPGIALAFLGAVAAGWEGKSLPLLLLGGASTGVLGVAAIVVVRRATRLPEDAALGIVLSVFFGAGVALLGVIQQLPTGHAAGLESFVYGKTASMLARDAWLIGAVAALCLAVGLAIFKELSLLSFDAEFAQARGYPTLALDAALMAMVVAVTIIGLQAVGLVLMIALLVIPPAAARFWTDRVRRMAWIAAAFGGVSAFAGALVSAADPRLPSGATIVLTAAAVFVASALFGTRRGAVLRWWRQAAFDRQVALEHLLRGAYELSEARREASASVGGLLALRTWSPSELRRAIRHAQRRELVRRDAASEVRLTARGELEAQRLTRQHRLWELYLITHAEVAPSRVDRGADDIEHVLDPETLRELEALLESSPTEPPASPHAIAHPDPDRRSRP